MGSRFPKSADFLEKANVFHFSRLSHWRPPYLSPPLATAKHEQGQAAMTGTASIQPSIRLIRLTSPRRDETPPECGAACGGGLTSSPASLPRLGEHNCRTRQKGGTRQTAIVTWTLLHPPPAILSTDAYFRKCFKDTFDNLKHTMHAWGSIQFSC